MQKPSSTEGTGNRSDVFEQLARCATHVAVIRAAIRDSGSSRVLASRTSHVSSLAIREPPDFVEHLSSELRELHLEALSRGGESIQDLRNVKEVEEAVRRLEQSSERCLSCGLLGSLEAGLVTELAEPHLSPSSLARLDERLYDFGVLVHHDSWEEDPYDGNIYALGRESRVLADSDMISPGEEGA